MSARWFNKSLMVIGWLGFAAASAVYAHEPSNPAAVGNLSILVRASGLILHGKVVGVTYVNGIQDGGGLIPHGFVSYEITEVLFPARDAGRATVVLRFVGGPDGQGRVLDVVGVPKYQVGDEDVLFVKSNGETGCPLVMCEFGRYRVLDGLVYEAHGSPVTRMSTSKILTDGNGPLVLQEFSYQAPAFDDLMKNPSAQALLTKSGLTLEEARQKYEAEAPAAIKIGEAAVPILGTPRLGLELAAFKKTLSTAIGLLLPAVPPAIADADPKKPVLLPPVRETAPPK